jgi:hypothetical protein
VHVASACAGSGEWSDHYGSIVRSLSLHFCKRLFPGLEPVTSWSEGSSFTTAPRLPFPGFVKYKALKYVRYKLKTARQRKGWRFDTSWGEQEPALLSWSNKLSLSNQSEELTWLERKAPTWDIWLVSKTVSLVLICTRLGLRCCNHTLLVLRVLTVLLAHMTYYPFFSRNIHVI